MTYEAVLADKRQDLTNSLLDAAVSASRTAHVLIAAVACPALEVTPFPHARRVRTICFPGRRQTGC